MVTKDTGASQDGSTKGIEKSRRWTIIIVVTAALAVMAIIFGPSFARRSAGATDDGMLKEKEPPPVQSVPSGIVPAAVSPLSEDMQQVIASLKSLSADLDRMKVMAQAPKETPLLPPQITAREYFAGQAIAGFCSTEYFREILNKSIDEKNSYAYYAVINTIARAAFDLADRIVTVGGKSDADSGDVDKQ